VLLEEKPDAPLIIEETGEVVEMPETSGKTAKVVQLRRPPPPEQPLSWFETMRRRALKDEADGKCIVMRNPQIRPRVPRKPRWEY
jgi:hypothetical protein